MAIKRARLHEGWPAPKDLPILFKPFMVQEIFDDNKGATSRLIKGDDLNLIEGWEQQPLAPRDWEAFDDTGTLCGIFHCPYGCRNDLLWVRENWAVRPEYDELAPSQLPSDVVPHYEAGPVLFGEWGKGRPSIHLPQRLARLWLKVVQVTPRQLKDYTEADAHLEGFETLTDFLVALQGINEHRDEFVMHPDTWFWFIEFERVK